MKLLNNIMASFCGLLLLQGCASTSPDVEEEVGLISEAEVTELVQPTPKAQPRPENYPAARFEKETLYQLLVAEVAGYRGQYDTALKKYVEMTIKSRDPGVAARATRLASYLKRYPEALQTAQIWAEEEPNSLDAHRHAADQFMRIGDLESAILHMEAVKRLGGLANFDVFAYRAANLDDESRATLLDAISRMLEDYAQDEQLLFSKAVLLEQSGRLEEALALTNILLEDKKNINVIILKVNALRDLHRAEDAVKFLDDALEELPDNRRLRLIYARFLFETDRLNAARTQYEWVLDRSPSDGDVLFALALIAMEQKKDESAKKYLNQMIRWNRRASEAHFYLGSIAEKDKDYPIAIREYKQVGNGYEFLPAQARIGSMMIDQGRLKEARDYLERIRAENPGRYRQLIMVEAQLLSERGFEKEVFSLLDEALAVDSDNVDLLYFRAMTGEKFDRLDILERDLREIIRLEPNNADALNALGYSLTDQTSRHKEALVLIQKALTIKPNEAAFIDSMGWVLYRLEKLEEAVKFLRQALDMFANDEVAAHLGEVLWNLGEKLEAGRVWEKALELKPDSEILNAVIIRFGSQ
ncbi:MAG: tetratricopeptide repeat protein [Gammaproteobacteria bacterium]|nr:tetratricopeptide repeat protein [Gammaproteobacteria bacterium]